MGRGKVRIYRDGADLKYFYEGTEHTVGSASVSPEDIATAVEDYLTENPVAADWDTLENKPETFTPSVHSHDGLLPTGGTEGQMLVKSNGTNYAVEWSDAPEGGSAPMAILTKSVAANQNVGGANNTEVWWTWDGYDKLDTGFSFTATSSEITVTSAGWYQIRFVGNVEQSGAARTTIQGILRINGGTTQRKGSIRDYTRGSSYGNCSPGLDCIIELEANDVIEVGTRIEDTDATYTLSTNGAEIADDENLLMITKVG